MEQRDSGPSGGDIIAGLVLVFFGLCILLVGGGCTVLWIVMIVDEPRYGGSDAIGMLLVSIFAAGAGLFATYKGVQMFRKKKS